MSSWAVRSFSRKATKSASWRAFNKIARAPTPVDRRRFISTRVGLIVPRDRAHPNMERACPKIMSNNEGLVAQATHPNEGYLVASIGTA